LEESQSTARAPKAFLKNLRAAPPFPPIIIANVYFIYYLALSLWLPFFNIYLLDSGYTGGQVGIITGVFQSMLFFVVPIWGLLADRFGNRLAMHIALAGVVIMLWFLRLVPSYLLLVFYMMCFAFTQHPIGMLTDSMAITYVKHSQRVSFGQLRVWGSVSWAIGSVLMGRYLLTHDSSSIFRIAPLVYGLAWLILWLYKKPDGVERVRVSFSLPELKAIFANKRIIIFLILLSFLGIGFAPLYIFINLYFRDIGASNQLIGLAFSLMAVSEVPMFFLAGHFIKRFGAAKVLLFAIAIGGIRLFLYGFISNPILAILLGLAQGLTFSLFWVVVVEIVHNLVPQQWRATAQSLIWAFHIGGGITVGNMTIGWLSDFLPMQKVMMMSGGMTMLVLVGMTVYFYIFNQPHYQTS
jgi:MFS family permease